MYKSHEDVLFFVFGAVLCRAVLLFAFPNLSDDIYRFLWDGHLITDGISPFLQTPSQYLESLGNDPGKYGLLYDRLNSPDYYSIYPPVCQMVFSASAWIFEDNLFWSAVFMKSIFLISETITIYFLLKLTQLLRLPQRRVLLYALNPLVIIELCGNLHFEAIMVLFLVLALWTFVRRRYKLFGFFMALSVGAKLLPLLFLPFFLKRMRLRDLAAAGITFCVTLLLLFLPFIDQELIQHLFASINLYFQKFEFNASIYYLVRWVGFQIKGYNVIQTAGPLLSLATMGIILYMAYKERTRGFKTLLEFMLLAFSCYLFFATTVHPWYLTIPILLSVFTFYRYPMFWSGLICLTYVNYAYNPYHENLWVVALEYMVVYLIFLMEVFKFPLVPILFTITNWILKRLGFRPLIQGNKKNVLPTE